MSTKKEKSIPPISFEKNVDNNYYTIVATDEKGHEFKFQALIFDRDQVQKDQAKREGNSLK